MYVVTGAAGQLGRLVINALLRSVPAREIIAAARSPAQAFDLGEQGISVREADYTRPETLKSAFEGATRLLLISSNLVTGRLSQHEAVIDAALAAGVEVIGYTSMLKADSTPAHLAQEHRATEQVIARSGIPAAILRNGWYTENKTLGLDSVLQHGAFIGSAAGGRFSGASRQDYAEAAAAALIGGASAARTYELAGDTAFTMAELAGEVSRQTGRSIAYADLAEADFKGALLGAGLPEDLAGMLADADAAATKDALFDNGGELSRLIGRPTTPWQDTVKDALAALA